MPGCPYSSSGGRRMRKKLPKNSRKKRGKRGGSMIMEAAPVLSLLALNQYLHKTMGRKSKTNKMSRRKRSFRR